MEAERARFGNKDLEQLPKHSKLDVYGPSRDDLPHRLAAHPRINIMGWKEEIFGGIMRF